MKPTQETYSALQAAYEHFNRELFAGELPECLITLQRKEKRMYGYFWGQRFEELGGEQKTDEIAMNPQHFKQRTIEEVLSTLAHEMAHQWQAHCGTPSRKAYHNREWAEKMESIGLMPSDTGQPGGKKTGQQMTHYIIPGGLFEQVCAALLFDGFHLAWGEIVVDIDEDQVEKGGGSGKGKTTRVRFTCPDCDANAWGKPTLKLICGDCLVPMIAE
ncbi:MAG: SprT-like domain-containing protein [Methylovulum sp.]|nr:SprT-like domain-containing protein [Methylovulum sp.]